MGESTHIIGSETPPTKEKKEGPNVKEVHIAVFFDGTNNNAVQKAYYDDSLLNVLRNENKRIPNPFKDSSSFKSVSELEDTISKLELIRRNLIIGDDRNAATYSDELYEIQEKINKCRDDLEQINLHPELTTSQLASDVKHSGYSNIAILYSMFDTENKECSSIRKHFYIEGAGANDISGKKIGSEFKMNINGLGFGLGVTGVTALVSKAVIHITSYVDSIKGLLDNETQLKIYVFGFSRGATCARLFTHLLTRSAGETLPKREHEFSYYCCAPIFDNGRINFLEEFKKRNKVKVEFLGIYDTVASIGFLKQKDGFHDPLRASYALMPNYKDNWHYRNVTEYGLYTSSEKEKLANVCHIGALDEFRENFAFTNLGKTVPNNAIEILIPGCHSDVGGGYIDEETSQEMILHKTTKKVKSFSIEKKGILESFKEEELRTYITFDPMEKGKRQEMSLASLEKLGWIESKSDAKRRKSLQGNAPIYTLRAVENDNIAFKHVKFKRSTFRGYSDISLQMMIECCDKKCKLKVFQAFKPSIYDYTKNPDLKTIGDEIVKHVDVPSGQRIWIIPEGGYAGENYRKLRLKYLHFTATGRIVHFNFELGKGIIEGSLENFGNKPNFDLSGTLCRITYDGDKRATGNDGFTDKSYEQEVKYLYDLVCDLEHEHIEYVKSNVQLN